MENFPQTYEPTGSQSILEQFVGLKNFMNNKLNSNEYLKTVEQTLTEEQKAQARENIGAGASKINIIDNLTSQSSNDALSGNQGRVLNEKINSSVQTLNQTISQNVNELQRDIDANGGDIAGLQGDVSQLNQESARALKTPLSAPSSTELVGIDNSNSQVRISTGNGTKIENDLIKTYDVIYDITSSDSSKNWGYTGGIITGIPINGKDFSKYSKLKVYCNGANPVSSRIYEIDLTRPATNIKVPGYPYMGVGTDTAFDDIADDKDSAGIYFDISLVSADKTTFLHFRTGYTTGSVVSYKNGNEHYYVYRIEGWY